MRAQAAPASKETVIDLPSLSIRAAVGSIDVDERTVEIIFSTGAPVTRMDWWTGKRYIEVLSMDSKAVRLERLNSAGPLLDSHSSYTVGDVFGAIVSGSARVEKGKGLATVKFSRRDDVEPYFQDVRDGIIRSFSVGYTVHKFEEEDPGKNKLPIRTAVDWEPFEVSLVPMPADVGAKVRGTDPKVGTNQCVIVPKVITSAVTDEDRNRFIRLARARR